MELDTAKIDEAVLPLLQLTLHDHCRAWKGFDWDVMDRIYKAGFIDNPRNKNKSVVPTEGGLAASKAAFEKLIAKPNATKPSSPSRPR
jgi:hypothetical protein